MTHIPSENRILISLGEFISIARRKISPTLPTDENEPEISEASKVTLLSLGISESIETIAAAIVSAFLFGIFIAR